MTNELRYPLVLEGIILSYVARCSPTYKVFKSMENLERFVGQQRIQVGRSDDDWVDAVIEGKVLVVDDGTRIEYDEDAYTGTEPKDGAQPNEPSPGNQELDGTEPLAQGSSDPSGAPGAKERVQAHRCGNPDCIGYYGVG